PPFIMGAEQDVTVDVHYTPTGAPATGDVEMVVAYTDASPVESADRLDPGEVKVALVRRLVGEPALVANPKALSFGAVVAGDTKSLPLTLKNIGFGNVAVQLAGLDAGHPDVRAALPAQASLVPDSGVDVPVVFNPSAEEYVHTKLTVTTTSDAIDPIAIDVEGTSLPQAKIGVEPGPSVDFNELPVR